MVISGKSHASLKVKAVFQVTPLAHPGDFLSSPDLQGIWGLVGDPGQAGTKLRLKNKFHNQACLFKHGS